MRARRGDDQPVPGGELHDVPRRRTSSARTSAGVRQTRVPISTIDWCSSGLISPSSI